MRSRLNRPRQTLSPLGMLSVLRVLPPQNEHQAREPAVIDLRVRSLARACVALGLAFGRLRPDLLTRVLSRVRSGARPANFTTALAAREAVVAVSLTCAGEGCLPRAIATAL